MKKTLVVLLMLITTSAFSQLRNFELVTHSGSSSQSVFIGLDNSATCGFDSGLGESELPPLPPSGAFDVRMMNDSLGNGSLKDYRNGNYSTSTSVVYQMDFQRNGSNGFYFTYSLPSTISMRIQDFVTGSVIDTTVTNSGTFTLSNSGISSLKLTVDYSNQILEDVNDDGTVDMNDVVAVYNTYIAFGYVLRYDLNYDSSVDMNDVNMIYGAM